MQQTTKSSSARPTLDIRSERRTTQSYITDNKQSRNLQIDYIYSTNHANSSKNTTPTYRCFNFCFCGWWWENGWQNNNYKNKNSIIIINNIIISSTKSRSTTANEWISIQDEQRFLCIFLFDDDTNPNVNNVQQ